MTTMTANSDESLQTAIGTLRDLYARYRYVKATFKTGKDRSIKQNRFSHAWYGQLARELREDDALGWKCYCKLHHGVPILRAEDEDFREAYDQAIKGLSYEQKLQVMKILPVTSRMNKEQLSKYAEAVQTDFARRGVMLEFPAERVAA